jgi:hypothetical protein
MKKKKAKRNSTLDSALDVLQIVFQKSKGSFSDEYQRLRLEQNWAEIIGEDLASETFPRKLYMTTLYIAARSSEAQYHCRFSQDFIKERINKFLGKNVVEHLNFSHKPKEKKGYDYKAKKFIDGMK